MSSRPRPGDLVRCYPTTSVWRTSSLSLDNRGNGNFSNNNFLFCVPQHDCVGLVLAHEPMHRNLYTDRGPVFVLLSGRLGWVFNWEFVGN